MHGLIPRSRSPHNALYSPSYCCSTCINDIVVPLPRPQLHSLFSNITVPVPLLLQNFINTEATGLLSESTPFVHVNCLAQHCGKVILREKFILFL